MQEFVGSAGLNLDIGCTSSKPCLPEASRLTERVCVLQHGAKEQYGFLQTALHYSDSIGAYFHLHPPPAILPICNKRLKQFMNSKWGTFAFQF
jgi:hypothetical protein